jgi:hypothetical protein
MFLKSSKHLSQMVHMISWGQVKNNDVINVAFGKTKTRQHSIHDPLKFFRGIYSSNQMAKISIGTNNPSHGDQFPKMFVLTLSPSPQWQLMVANFKSKVLKTLACPRASKISSSRGMAYLFEQVHLFTK